MPQGIRVKNPKTKPAYPIDTVGDYRLTIKIEGEKIQNIEDSCHYYTLKDGIIDVENVLNTDTINKAKLKRKLIVDSVCIYTKDTIYNIMTDLIIDFMDSLSSNDQTVWILKIPESIALSCYESCVDITYRARESEMGNILSTRHISHKLTVQNKDEKMIWADIAKYPFSISSATNFSPYNKISYNIPESTHVLIKVYNICGQVIDTVINAIQASGYYEKEWDHENQPNGIYLIQINAGDSKVVKKQLVIH